jgi:uncharacterized membrane protein YdjX (TVP38/TMEM64 family)
MEDKLNPEPEEEAQRRLWKPLAFLLFLVVLLVTYRVAGAERWIDAQKIAAWLDSFAVAWWAPLAITVFFVLFALVGLPGSVLTVASGAVWGWLFGGVVALLGTTIGTAAPYLLARMHAPAIERRMRHRAEWLHARLRDEGFTALLMFRLLPGIPYALINYAAGFAGIRPLHYFVATIVGTIPGVFIYTWAASGIFSGTMTVGGAIGRIAIAGSLLGGLVLISRFAASRLLSRRS